MARQQLGLADGGRLEHNYYEEGHGKNQSDRLGSVGKQAYLRGMAGKNHGETPTTMEDIARIMRDNLPCQGKETSVTRVVVVPPLDRPDREEGEIPVKGIRALHRISRLQDGRILGSPLSCKACITQQVSYSCSKMSCICSSTVMVPKVTSLSAGSRAVCHLLQAEAPLHSTGRAGSAQ